MLLDIALIVGLGLIMGAIFSKMKLPRIMGMIIAGIIIGPSVLNLIGHQVFEVSADLRQIALIIILTRAGLSLDIRKLKEVGRSALLMTFVPATIEIIGYVILAPLIFDIDLVDAAIMGSVMAAVSPAIIVPKMIDLMESGYGKKNSIPELILAGASVDDIFVIVIFTSLLALKTGGSLSYFSVLQVPISIISGIVVGLLVGFLLVQMFRMTKLSADKQTIVLIVVSFFLISLEAYIKNYLPFSALLSIMAVGMSIHRRDFLIQENLSKYYSKLWTLFEILLFTLVGLNVDLTYVKAAGVEAVILLLGALVFRIGGVFLSLLGSKLSSKERLFCAFAYIPKATVQAAIGAIPLSMGLASGKMILTVSVLAILVTAPLGLILMDLSYKKLLDRGE